MDSGIPCRDGCIYQSYNVLHCKYDILSFYDNHFKIKMRFVGNNWTLTDVFRNLIGAILIGVVICENIAILASF